MPTNDRSDSSSVRRDDDREDDPRAPFKALQQEAELELGASEAGDTGGVEHQGPAERAREADASSPAPAERRPEEEGEPGADGRR